MAVLPDDVFPGLAIDGSGYSVYAGHRQTSDKKSPQKRWGLVKVNSNLLQSAAGGLTEAIPGEAGDFVVHVEGGDGFKLAFVPDRQLPASAVDVVVEHDEDAFGQVPAQRRYLVADIADAAILALRFAADRRDRLEGAFELAIGVELDGVARDIGNGAGRVRTHHSALQGCRSVRPVADRIPRPPGHLVVEGPLADRIVLATAPDGELIAGAIGIFIEEHHDSWGQVPLERSHAVGHGAADAGFFGEARGLRGHVFDSGDLALKVAILKEIDRVLGKC